MMYRDPFVAGKADDPSRHRLLRAPIGGGAAVEVPLPQPLDEFRCSLPGHGTGCVLRTTENDGQHYFELDPIHGKGRELGRTRHKMVVLGRWALSPDGRQVSIPDNRCAGCFLDIRLDPLPVRRSESQRQIKGLGIINGLDFTPSGNAWLAHCALPDRPINLIVLPSFWEDSARSEFLYYVDARLKAHKVYASYLNAYGVLSPDEKRITLLGADVTSNIWAFYGAKH